MLRSRTSMPRRMYWLSRMETSFSALSALSLPSRLQCTLLLYQSSSSTSSAFTPHSAQAAAFSSDTFAWSSRAVHHRLVFISLHAAMHAICGTCSCVSCMAYSTQAAAFSSKTFACIALKLLSGGSGTLA